MDATITIKDAGLILLGIGLIILVFYLAYLVRNLVTTIKSVNRILADTEVISDIAAKRSKDVDKIIADVSASVGDISEILKGNQNTIAALTSIVNSLGSLKNLFAGFSKKAGKKDVKQPPHHEKGKVNP
ncbi:MAG: hypothetical protein LBT26_02020 [Clostridiales Family XIII bacterium]|jgi:ABC-type transporter Mla subunit MlaD|nr:hypothetical protein [Clostridiales Family XIII bacterium]